MIIGIEAERANTPQKTGVEHYAQQLILHLAEIDSVNEYRLYLRTKPESWFFSLPKNFSVKVMPFPIFWTQLRISWEMLIHPVDVLFIPASALPIVHPKKAIVTIHDIAWQFYPQSFTWFTFYFLKLSTWFALRFSSGIVAVSEATKKDLLTLYHVEPKKISVVHHGFMLESQSGMSSVLPVKKPYILFLSTLQPRKNLETLIAAFRLLKEEQPDLPHTLVVAGKPGWKFEPILEAIFKNKDIVTYLNHVSESEKSAILANADLLVVPSLYEGFGMQVLEGFAAGVPVAVSNVSSLPEVAGDAAVFFDPHNEQEIKQAIKKVLTDKVFSEQMRQKGKKRLQSFSWKQCAQQTLAVFSNSIK